MARPGTSGTLNMDNIVSSQPELGPSPPDGGYGWIVLFCAIVTQVCLTSIVSVYGAILLFTNLQDPYEDGEIFHFWDSNIVLAPVLSVVFFSIMEPWGKAVIPIANSPRMVAISGILFVGAGIILSKFSVDDEENEKIFNTFAGILIGFGSMITLQQSEILLTHYFRSKLNRVMTLYRLSLCFGFILMPVFVSELCEKYGTSMALFIFAGIILQNCMVVSVYSRPVYITKPLRQNYNILREGSDDEDEIYASRKTKRETVEADNAEPAPVSERIISAMVDERDERVIGSFNSEHTVKTIAVLEPPVVLRMDSTGNEERNPRAVERFENNSHPLYRETTIANPEPREDLFTYAEPTAGTLQRTANMKRNLFILRTIVRDPKFYGYAVVMIASKFSSLIIYLLFPAFVSQQNPKMTYSGVMMATAVTYIGSSGLNIISGFLSHTNRRKIVIQCNILLGSIAFYVLSLTSIKSFLVLFGVIATYSTNSIPILLNPISKKSIEDFDKSAIHSISSCIAGFFCLLLTFVHNHSYFMCFYIASGLQMVAFVLSFAL